MDTQQQQRRETSKIEETLAEGKEQEHVQQTGAAANSPPVLSASSSPSHEFSFTISLHSPAATMMTTKASSSPSLAAKTKHQQPPLAIDLSPADEIFFHGHLLPLHFLSHLHASSPRPSTHSLDGLALPMQDMLQEEKPIRNTTDSSSNTICSCTEDEHCITINNDYSSHTDVSLHNCERKERNSSSSSNKFRSFSLFGLSKWKKGSEGKEKSEYTENSIRRNKLKFDVTQFLKRYIKMVKPLLSSRGGRGRESVQVRRQSYSFSGMVSPRDTRELMRGRRGEFSAPASMRTSPTNSGLLSATAGVPSPVSESTMEELQAAIQAAIAHCKNSISTEGKNSQELPSSIPVN